ncbi:hypothetical protein [Spirosoma linguale]|uniref:Uncharacterized protein n=1 Tax=Spirosoma linguale (strain ATCC 33905 / DSM 74 / LMG 10896 / Claus 1) TaxID=504472 RepID=D2QCJ5_SPILD|nr:hypothetical protein Slin_1955 [Spirosoma linguale DSM 74]
MEKEDKVDPVYVKGFNEGYTIAQHMPELAEVLSKVKGKSDRLMGLQAGHKQYLNEQIEQIRTNVPHEKKIRARLPDWLKNDFTDRTKNSSTKSKGRDLEPDKD